MVINAGGLILNLDLRYLSSFKHIEDYQTEDHPAFFMTTVNELPSFSKKELIAKTIYYEKYQTNLGVLQQQYSADKWIGSILYRDHHISIYLNYDCFEAEYLLSQYAFVHWIKNNTEHLFIHGSSISYQNSGLLFCAKSGVGKSTQRALWEKYGNAICINDDKNVLSFEKEDICILPNPWSGKHFINTNQSACLRAIIFLKQGKENKVLELSAENAFPLLLAQMDLPHYDLKDAWEQALDQLLGLPLYLFECNMDKEAFYYLEDQLKKRGVFK